MNTALTQLGRLSDELIAYEMGERADGSSLLTEAGIAPRKERLLAGFLVSANPAEVDEHPDYRDRLTKFREDKKALEDACRAQDLELVTVLPLVAWQRVLVEHGLYYMRPDRTTSSITVRISDFLSEVEQEGQRVRDDESKAGKQGWALAGLWTVLMVASIYALQHVAMSPWLAVPLGVVGNVLTIMLLFWVHIRLPRYQRRANAQVIEKACRMWREDGTIWQKLMPNNTEPTPPANSAKDWEKKSYKDNTAQLRIEFPVPPDDIQIRIRKAAQTALPLWVACESRAISFLDSDMVVAIVKQQRQRVEERLREEAEARKNRALYDPIIYLVQGTAVGIVGQYGDFAIEQELVNRVLTTPPIA